MRFITIRAMASIAILSAVALGLSLWGGAQDKVWAQPKLLRVQAGEQTKKFVPASEGGHMPTLSATLVEPEKKAKEKEATVEVKVSGVHIIDPAAAHEQPKAGQGHLHYQLDNGPIIATTAEKLSFHELTPGEHKIVVMLAGNDHQPLSPQESLNVTIPRG
jgi:Family of unknown function (DUF6130)